MVRKALSVRLLYLVLAVSLLVSLFGCGANSSNTAQTSSEQAVTTQGETQATTQAGPNPDEPGWKKNAGTPVTLSWYVDNTENLNWGTDPNSKYISKKTGFNFDLSFNPSPDVTEDKMNTMIAANMLPDVVSYGYWSSFVPKMRDGGMLYSLNELADKYDPYFYKVAKKMVMNYYKQPDGLTYQYPNFAMDPTDIPQGAELKSSDIFVVRKDIYEAIGKPDMSTPAGFLDALRKVKAQFPSENGQPMIDFGYMSNFGEGGTYADQVFTRYTGGSLFENNEYFFDFNNPDRITWLKTLRQAYSEGLMSKSEFIDTSDAIKEKVLQGRYFAMVGYVDDIFGQIGDRWKKDPNSTYMAIDGPKGSQPRKLRTDYNPAGWLTCSITKNCKNPERAIQMMTYFLSPEGQQDLCMGEQGVTWDMVDGKPTYKPDTLNTLQTDPDFKIKTGLRNAYHFLLQRDYYALIYPLPDIEPIKQIKDWSVPYAAAQPWLEGVDPAGDSEEGKIETKVFTEWGKVLPQLLTAKSEAEFDKKLADFKAFKQKQGWDKVDAFVAKQIQANKDKMGVK